MSSQALITTIDAPPLAYSVPEAGKAIDVSESTMHRLINAGEIATVRVAGRTLIRAAELERYLAANETRKPKPTTKKKD